MHSSSSPKQTPKINVIDFPYYPACALNSATTADGNIASPELFTQYQKTIAARSKELKDNTRFTKKELAAEGEAKAKHGMFFLPERKLHVVLGKGSKHEKKDEEGNVSEFTHTLGSGSFGKVKIGQDQENKFYAVKIINLQNDHTGSRLGHTLNEHKNLVFLGKPVSKVERTSPTHGLQYNFVMDLAPGIDLFEFLKKYSRKCNSFTSAQRIDLVIKILKLISDLHENKKMLHRDIKPENFIFDLISGTLTLIDYAFAIPFTKNEIIKTKDRVGTPCYLPPEVLLNSLREYSEKSDIYCLGLCLSEIFHFMPGDLLAQNKLISKHHSSFLNNTAITDYKARRLIYDFVESMLDFDPNKRPALDKCIAFFEKIKLEHFKEIKTQVIIVNVEQWLSTDKNPGQRNALIKAFQEFNQVWLIDTRAEFKKMDYVHLRKIFEDNQIGLGQKIFHHPGSNMHDITQFILSYAKAENYNFVASTWQTPPVVESKQENNSDDSDEDTESEVEIYKGPILT